MNYNQVAVVIPYFGKWPEWIELYFYSCGRNPKIDFIFYTDCPLPQHQYKNTIFYQCSYEEYSQRISRRLGINYICEKPYKLTDLKPFIGVIHQEKLMGYDFWGMGDLDLIYGDLSMLVNDEMIERYDLITTHNYHIAGHFCLCRNNEYYRNLCFKIKDWKQKMESDKAMSIDEIEWSYLVYPQLKNVGRLHHYVLSHFGVDVWKYRDRMNRLMVPRKHIIEYWIRPEPQKGQAWVYDMKKGTMTDPQGRELPYLHFLFFKKTPWKVTDDHWKEGFWQLDNDFEKYSKIEFSLDGVKGIIE